MVTAAKLTRLTHKKRYNCTEWQVAVPFEIPAPGGQSGNFWIQPRVQYLHKFFHPLVANLRIITTTIKSYCIILLVLPIPCLEKCHCSHVFTNLNPTIFKSWQFLRDPVKAENLINVILFSTFKGMKKNHVAT
jgi:hypothetical protein